MPPLRNPAYELEPTSQYAGTTLALDGQNPSPHGYDAGNIYLGASETFTGQYSMITHKSDSAVGTTAGVFNQSSQDSSVLVHDPPVATTLNDIIIYDTQLNTFQEYQNLSALDPEFGTTSTGALAYNLVATSTGKPVTSTVSWSGSFTLSYSLPSTNATGMSHLSLSSNGLAVTWFGGYFSATYATATGTQTYTTYSFVPGSSITINYDLVNGSASQSISWNSQAAAQWFLPSYSGPYQQTTDWSLTDNYSLYGVTGSTSVAHAAPAANAGTTTVLGSLNGLFTTPDSTSKRRS